MCIRLNINELNAHIIDWAKERGLDTKGTVEAQSIKTVEELSELIKAICKDKKEDIIDSIGDVYVTLVIGNMLDEQVDLSAIVEYINDLADKQNIKKPYAFSKKLLLQDMSNDIFNVLELKYDPWLIEHVTARIISITHMYNLDFVECVESAYNTIKNRHGKLVNGTYVKDEDLKNEITDIFFDSSTDVSH
jgi:NTP pyrophosphatase (non-canonical NTP hydrolase)